MSSTKTKEPINSQSLIGYAVLAENLDNNNASFIDNFLPLILQGVIDIDDNFTISELSIYIEENFGLQLPFYVLDYSLRKLCRNNTLKFDQTAFKYNVINPKSLNVIDKRDEILNNFQLLLNRMKDYIEEYYDLNLPISKLERMLENFSNVYAQNISNNSPFEVKSEHHQALFLVGKFLKYIEQNDTNLFKIYQKFYIGYMISSAMYFTQPDRFTQKFKHTLVFLDTTLIIFALGYAGQERAQPVLQLIQALKKQHAQLRCFAHTIEEIKSVLNSCLRKLEKGEFDRFGTVEYFINKNYSRSEILTIIHALENDIEEKLKIKIVDKPDYSDQSLYKYNIDEVEYGDYIRSHIQYTFESSLSKDLDSLNAIYKLRKGEFSDTIESSKAIFVTNNNKLVNVIKNKFISDFHKPEYTPPFISDYVLATLQWIKNPDYNTELPKKMIIANCLAATEPSEKMIEKYLDRIEKEKNRGEITEEDFALLRTDSEARALMMEKTVGNEENIIWIDLKELAELTIQRKTAEANKINEEQKSFIEEMAKERQQLLQDTEEKALKLNELEKTAEIKEQARIIANKNKSEKFAKGITNAASITFLFVFSLWYIIAYNKLSDETYFILKVIIQIIIPTLGLLGIGLLHLIKPIKIKLKEWLTNKIYSVFYK